MSLCIGTCAPEAARRRHGLCRILRRWCSSYGPYFFLRCIAILSSSSHTHSLFTLTLHLSHTVISNTAYRGARAHEPCLGTPHPTPPHLRHPRCERDSFTRLARALSGAIAFTNDQVMSILQTGKIYRSVIKGKEIGFDPKAFMRQFCLIADVEMSGQSETSGASAHLVWPST